MNKQISGTRSVVLDCETTGLSHENGHKIIEIGALEMINRRLTGRAFHHYLDPQREVDEDAEEVHGWNRESLKAASEGAIFADIAESLLDFIKGSTLIIHNAPFDMGHMDAEMIRIGLPRITGQVLVCDTLVMANNKYPGRRNNLDALAKRMGVDTSARTHHGALLDAEILAEVYLQMTTRQDDLHLDAASAEAPLRLRGSDRIGFVPISESLAQKLPVAAALPEEIKRHQMLIEKIRSTSGNNDFGF